MKKFFLSLFFLIIVFVAGAIYYFKVNSAPVSNDQKVQQFVINQGEGVRQISKRLLKNNLVRNDLVFLALSYKLGLNTNLQAGLFRLSPSQSTEQIIEKLSKGGSHDYWLKILGGQRLAELEQDFDPSLEGYLYPDSYLIPEGYSTEQIVQIISANFDKKYDQAIIGSNSNFSKADIITLASLIEREARTLESKKMVAGILHNRLKIKMALQVDASAQYVRDTKNKPSKYWLPASKNDLSLVSPYNTYLNPGLPPGPICNPGYDSIFAALNPTDSEYLFYITGNDNKMHYAITLDEHNENINKYLR